MPVVLMAALRKAGTSVCQPIDRFELELPAQAHQPVAALLGRLGSVVLDVTASPGYTTLAGHLPSARLPDLASRLPDLTGGEGVLITRFDHYASATGTPPSRRRRGPDPGPPRRVVPRDAALSWPDADRRVCLRASRTASHPSSPASPRSSTATTSTHGASGRIKRCQRVAGASRNEKRATCGAHSLNAVRAGSLT